MLYIATETNEVTDKYITYKGGYKYQLHTDYHIETDITPVADYDKPETYLKLDMNGQLTVLKGYAWDGPSGKVPDTKRNMRASLVHDAFYQLLRNEILEPEQRDVTDLLFKQMCKEDGVWSWIAHLYYLGLRKFGDFAADPANKREEMRAPMNKN
ncbi:MAG: DUF1353 domain-containing protein [Flavobacteriales bacterium]|nr:DUF1353 domain-containing protein [Flavobacteriales bacterium]